MRPKIEKSDGSKLGRFDESWVTAGGVGLVGGSYGWDMSTICFESLKK